MKRPILEHLESQIAKLSTHIETLSKDSQDYDVAVRNLTAMSKSYTELVKAQAAAENEIIKAAEQERVNREAEKLARDKFDEETRQFEIKMELERQKLEAEVAAKKQERIDKINALRAENEFKLKQLEQEHKHFMVSTIIGTSQYTADRAIDQKYVADLCEFEKTQSYGSQIFKDKRNRLSWLRKR